MPPPTTTTSRDRSNASWPVPFVLSTARWCAARCPGGSLQVLGETKAQLLSLQQLRCAVMTARAGSFTAAAEQLDVSQPAVAEQIRNLEAALGVELFARAGRGVRPTVAGSAFVDRAAAVLTTLDEAVAS